MAIAKAAIDRFLADKGRPYIEVKGLPRDKLDEIIKNVTGKYYRPKTEPRYYQRETLAFALTQWHALLFLAMRLGKTKIALDFASHLRRANMWQGVGLVVAHAPIALDSIWRPEAAKHSDLKIRCVQNNWDQFVDALESDCDLIITPWSGLQNMFSIKKQSRKGKAKLYPDHQKIRDVAELLSLVIMDEIHLCQNVFSLRFKIADELTCRAKFRLGLTGTPVGRDPSKVWAQAYLVDRGLALSKNYFFFMACFGEKKMNWALKRQFDVFDNKKLPLLQQKLAPVALTYAKSEVHLDNVAANVVRLPLLRQQQREYSDIIDRLIDSKRRHDGELLARETENTFVRLRQVSSGFLPFVDSFGNAQMVDFPCSKLEWLRALLEGQLSELQTIIFHEFIHTGDVISNLLDDLKIKHARLQGKTGDKAGEVRKFRDGKVGIIVANTAVGGAGIDLQNADYMLFYECPLSPTVRQQAEARPLALSRGKRLLVVDDLICSPIEQRIYDLIKEGKHVMKVIMKDPALLHA